MNEGKPATFRTDDKPFKIQTNPYTETTDSETSHPEEPLQVKWKRALINIFASRISGTVHRIETNEGERFLYHVKTLECTTTTPGETVTKILAIDEDLRQFILTIVVKNTAMFGAQVKSTMRPCPSGEGMSQTDIERLATRVAGGEY